ncbi:hypothetical protein GC170_00050 [bacterium]|nr:hypothetical protein [bacterium]
MKSPQTNGSRKTNFRKYQPRTGVTIFLVTIVGSALGLLAGIVIARGADKSYEGLVDGITAAAEAVIAVGGITLVWFFLWEGAQLTKTMRSSAYSDINDRFMDLSKAMLEGCEHRDWFTEPPGDDQSLSRDSRAYLCDMAFTAFEEVYYHRIEFQLLDDENWESWLRSIKSFVNRPYVRQYWRMVRLQYSASFAAEIDKAIMVKSDH